MKKKLVTLLAAVTLASVAPVAAVFANDNLGVREGDEASLNSALVGAEKPAPQPVDPKKDEKELVLPGVNAVENNPERGANLGNGVYVTSPDGTVNVDKARTEVAPVEETKPEMKEEAKPAAKPEVKPAAEKPAAKPVAKAATKTAAKALPKTSAAN